MCLVAALMRRRLYTHSSRALFIEYVCFIVPSLWLPYIFCVFTPFHHICWSVSSPVFAIQFVYLLRAFMVLFMAHIVQAPVTYIPYIIIPSLR
jgi:hypothetical protein